MRIAFLLSLLTPVLSVAAERIPIPRFTDPQRRARLAAAFPEVEQVFRRFWNSRGAPGLVFGIVIDGDLAFVKGFGVRDRATQAPVTPETVFRIASMTKSFTTLAILKLRDEGKLSLEDPASKWIPELAGLDYPTRDTAPITIRQLLTHGAGLPEDNPWGDRQLAIPEERFTRWLEAGLPFSTPPNTAFEYSNYGFALLGRVVARTSGMPYPQYLAAGVLDPLEMRSTTLEAKTVPAGRLAKGYRKRANDYEEEPLLADGAFGSMGGLLTSAQDLGRYVAFLLSAYPARNDADIGPVRRSSLREMQQPWRPSSFAAGRPEPDAPLQAVSGAYGFGLGIRQDCRFDRVVSHGGGLPGFGSFMAWLPAYGVGIFAMANLTYAAPSQAVEAAFDVLRKTGALQPRILPAAPVLYSTRDSISRLWDEWDDRLARELAAGNLFLDISAGDRRMQIDRIKKDLGACKPDGEIQSENLLRGKFLMSCERGSVDVHFTLAPTTPPKLQYLSFIPAKRLDEPARITAELLASQIAAPDETLTGLAATSLDLAGLRRRLEFLRMTYRSCRLGETLSGDGRASVLVRFDCEGGPLNVDLRMDADAKLSAASFTKPAGVSCVP